jgi:hypothetical protein
MTAIRTSYKKAESPAETARLLAHYQGELENKSRRALALLIKFGVLHKQAGDSPDYQAACETDGLDPVADGQALIDDIVTRFINAGKGIAKGEFAQPESSEPKLVAKKVKKAKAKTEPDAAQPKQPKASAKKSTRTPKAAKVDKAPMKEKRARRQS